MKMPAFSKILEMSYPKGTNGPLYFAKTALYGGHLSHEPIRLKILHRSGFAHTLICFQLSEIMATFAKILEISYPQGTNGQLHIAETVDYGDHLSHELKQGNVLHRSGLNWLRLYHSLRFQASRTYL